MTPGAPNLYYGMTRTEVPPRGRKLVDVNGDGVLDWVEPGARPDHRGFAGLPWLRTAWLGLRNPAERQLTATISAGAPAVSGGPGRTDPPGYVPGVARIQFKSAGYILRPST